MDLPSVVHCGCRLDSTESCAILPSAVLSPSALKPLARPEQHGESTEIACRPGYSLKSRSLITRTYKRVDKPSGTGPDQQDD